MKDQQLLTLVLSFAPDVQELLGDADALANPGASLKAYQRALELRRALGTTPPSAKLLNNSAVMHYRAGLYDTARTLFTEALEKVLEGLHIPPPFRCLFPFS